MSEFTNSYFFLTLLIYSVAFSKIDRWSNFVCADFYRTVFLGFSTDLEWAGMVSSQDSNRELQILLFLDELANQKPKISADILRKPYLNNDWTVFIPVRTTHALDADLSIVLP